MKQIAKKERQKLRNNTAKRVKASLAINKRWQNVRLLEENVPVSRPSYELLPTNSHSLNSNDMPIINNAVGLNSIDIRRPSADCVGNDVASPLSSLIECFNSNNNETKPLNTRISDLDKMVNNTLHDFVDQERFAAPEYKLIDITCLKELVSNLVCPSCLEGKVAVSWSDVNGFASKLTLECENCPDLELSCYTSKKVSGSKAFDVNRRVVKSFMSIGEGFGALEKYCLVMNMDGMSSKTYNYHSNLLAKSSVKISDLNLEVARSRVREVYKDIDSSINEDSVIDIGVSYDGSWHKRGHTSNYGVGIVIELQTGLVIDYCVLSKYCQTCVVTAKELGADSPEFYFWFLGHKSECFKNYEGSSPAMETKAAEILWKRSLEYNFRYRTILSDGDSSTFNHIQSLNVYDSDISVEKEECVNHVAKRLGTGLRNVVQTAKAKGVTLGGRKYGSLKDTTITKLTKYYQKSILSNQDNVPQMQQDILATLYHCVSTDAVPKHTKCPKGETS